MTKEKGKKLRLIYEFSNLIPRQRHIPELFYAFVFSMLLFSLVRNYISMISDGNPAGLKVKLSRPNRKGHVYVFNYDVIL